MDAALRAHPASLVFSIHSFTDMYEGSKREVEIGMLFSESDDLASPVRGAGLRRIP